MKPINENFVMHIKPTNICRLSYAKCIRLFGYYRKPFFITLDEVKKAIYSLKGFK